MKPTMHWCFSFLIVFLFAWAGTGVNSLATTYYVTTNGADGLAGTNWATAKQTIQAGVNVATNADDIVVVSNGTYFLSSEISVSEAITVRSENGRDYTAVNGSNTVRCFSITSPGAVIDGFTITNANNTVSMYGGGVYMTGGTVTNCIISGNSAPGDNINGQGGGIYMTGGTVVDCIISSNSAYYYGGGAAMRGGTLKNSSFTSNSATQYDGGGMWIDGGTVTECTFTDNTANRFAGGIRVEGGVIRNCVLTENSASGNWGGCIYMAAGTVTNCTISGNSAPLGSSMGGGIYMTGGTVADCTVSNNSSCYYGGGIYIANAGPQVQNCVISFNRVTTYDGGGVHMAGGLLRNCLVIGNLTQRWGGGVRLEGNSVAENCTVVGNQSNTKCGGCIIVAGTVTNTIIYFNDAPSDANVYDYYDGTNLAFSCTTPLVAGTGNITNNPSFIDPGSGYGTNHVAGDYHLNKDSYCINTGTNLGWMSSATDLGGNARILAGRVDMGAYEAVPPPSGTMFSVR